MGLETALAIGAIAAGIGGIAGGTTSIVTAAKSGKKSGGGSTQAPTPAEQMTTPPVDKNKIGRNALISTTPQGVLSNASTSRSTLLGN